MHILNAHRMACPEVLMKCGFNFKTASIGKFFALSEIKHVVSGGYQSTDTILILSILMPCKSHQ